MSAHAHSIYPCIYMDHKNLFLYLSADWRLAPKVAAEKWLLLLHPGVAARPAWEPARAGRRPEGRLPALKPGAGNCSTARTPPAED
jgi:hypothetical protein